MNPFLSLLSINKKGRQPLYLQIAGQLTDLIRNGSLPAGQRLMSTRQAADLLSLHRRTIVRAYEELLAQGWLDSQMGSGTFVARQLPEIHPQKLLKRREITRPATTAGFSFDSLPHLNRELPYYTSRYHLDEGFPDSRLAPLEELSRAYKSQMLTGNPYVRLGYADPMGSSWLREELSSYLNETRGLKTNTENILITRGVIMGIYLVSTALLNRGDLVVVAEKGYQGANNNFLQAGAKLIKIPVDENGMQVELLEPLCVKKKIRLVYITSHHHYPTTVPLRVERRIRLLQLAEKYGFIIFEDDYDYDFHYLSKPLLPLAGSDTSGMVLYCGSFTKTISPAFRVGYLTGSENVIRHLSQLRRIIDRQGDSLLENAMADLLQQGVVQRHLRKSLRLYKARRDIFCDLLKVHLGKQLEFQIPDGGMAVWTNFDSGIDLTALSKKALQQDLYFSDGRNHHPDWSASHATRLGFASSTPEELERCVEILTGLMPKSRKQK
ncbi:MAG: PLP-dependent aminotransferase family protein [Bacteroidota bacterium]|nr:PLP-dependent aminotransferase family protein [Bacteroidota bacterium]